MYAAQHNKDGSLKHSAECKMAFGKKDAQCPRCQELLGGAEVRKGWQSDYYAKKKREEEWRLRDIKNHNCEQSGCGSVCTAFEW